MARTVDALTRQLAQAIHARQAAEAKLQLGLVLIARLWSWPFPPSASDATVPAILRRIGHPTTAEALVREWEDSCAVLDGKGGA